MDEILEKLINSCLELAKELLDKEFLTIKEIAFLNNIDLFVDHL